WDARRLRQVISNLLGNAIQYGAIDMPVDLTITGEASEVVINVHNDGEPIPPDRVLTLFHPMSRRLYHGLVHRPGNIGLGLYIVREIATAHAGSVQVTSSRAAGTDFTVRLPREPVSALPA
ncbi:MAG: ATP-binding protein, partial [Pseudohongiella sp.]